MDSKFSVMTLQQTNRIKYLLKIWNLHKVLIRLPLQHPPFPQGYVDLPLTTQILNKLISFV